MTLKILCINKQDSKNSPKSSILIFYLMTVDLNINYKHLKKLDSFWYLQFNG